MEIKHPKPYNAPKGKAHSAEYEEAIRKTAGNLKVPCAQKSANKK